MLKNIFSITLLLSIIVGSSNCDVGNVSKNSDTNSSVNDSNNFTDNSLNIEEPSEELDDVLPGDSSDGINPFCDSEANGPDGGGGFLWKAVSEADGNLVILFPAEFDVKFLSVQVVDLSGNIEVGSFAGFTNGDRQTWRFTSPGSAYTGEVTVDAITQECFWFVPNPSKRQD